MKVVGGAPKTETVTFKTTDKHDEKKAFAWWNGSNKQDRGVQLLSTAAYLKDNQQYRYRQTAVYSRLYGNMSLFSFAGATSKIMDQMTGLPTDRPTFNLIQSASDTLVSRIAQQRPTPIFLTDGSDYKQRNLAKKLNNFILGEFYHAKAYEIAPLILRDALVSGTGVIKVLEDSDHRVRLERVLQTELLTDASEGIYGEPRQMYQLKLIDKAVLMDAFPEMRSKIENAARAYPDQSSDSSKSVSDMVMVVEGWRLKSGSKATDGRHTIACSSCTLFDEQWDKDKFPFVFLHYSPKMLGFWAQGLAEQLMGTQLEINSLLYTISKAIRLVGVPRVFVEDGSKVVSSQLNNEIGSIVKYRGTKPEYTVAPCIPGELYEQLQRLINYGYQQCGVSAMQAGAQKPAGLNSGEAQRVYDDISTDRFATLSRRYDDMFVALAYQVIELARDIAEEQGSYSTVYPNKDTTKEIDLPDSDIIGDTFVIQAFNMSSLPRDPAGRMQKVTEMIQAGMISIKEGRRLLDYPDLQQIEKLATASEERIFQYLDAIVEDGDFNGPDSFMDLQLAKDLSVQYYNLYASAKLEEDKCQLIRDFFTQANDMLTGATQAMQAQQQQAAMASPNTPQAQAQPLPQSPLVPNAATQ